MSTIKIKREFLPDGIGGGGDVAISTTQPVNNEVLWINPNEVPSGIGSYISNTYGTSQEIGYSQEYVNTYKANKGEVIWTNTSASSEFSAQTINFDSNYSYYDIISWVDGTTYETTRVYLNKKTIIQMLEGGYIRTRYATATNNSITFTGAKFYSTYASGTDNNYQCIPFQVIGYK